MTFAPWLVVVNVLLRHDMLINLAVTTSAAVARYFKAPSRHEREHFARCGPEAAASLLPHYAGVAGNPLEA